MFAVPGWAVSATSLVEEKKRPKTSGQNKESVKSIAKSKKRKRNHDSGDTQLSQDGPDHEAYDDRSNSKKPSQSPLRPSRPKKTSRATSVGHKLETLGADLQTSGLDTLTTNDHAQDDNRALSSKTKRKEKGVKPVERVDKQAELQRRKSSQEQHLTKAIQKQPGHASSLPIVKLTPLQAKMRNKLTSARFRHLNETLYTTSSSDALTLFTSSPDLFAEYHAGFSQQVKESWPQNPVDGYVHSIKVRGALSEPRHGQIPLPRRKTSSCTVVDLGCGDAPLARGCQSVVKTLKLRFHNYDLHAPNTFVTKADVSDLPLRDGEADIAIFCLSLMGTNWISFVEEAWRILRGDGKGEVWVAEVKSRFGRVTKGRVVDNSVGKRRKIPKSRKPTEDDEYDGPENFAEDERADREDDETDVSAFVKVFTRRGFQLREGSIHKKNKMFVTMMFTKTGIPTAGKFKGLKWNGKEYQKQSDGKPRLTSGQKGDEETTPEDEAKVLKPCVYKTR